MDRRSNLIIKEKPELRRASMVCGINGWVDGGEAATGTVEYMIKKLKAKEFAEMPLDRFHIYQVPGQVSLRPHIKIQDGILKEHSYNENHFYYWINPNAKDDLVLFVGAEPCLDWEGYAGAILDIADELNVGRIYLPGGVMDETPHTREPGVSCTCSSKALKEEMKKYCMDFGSYEGPGSFATTLLYLCRDRHIEVVNIMVRSTYYPEFNVVISHNPRAIRAIMVRLNGMLRLNMDISELDKQVDELEVKLGFMASQNPEFRAYIDELEKDFVEVKYEEPLDVLADEAIQFAEDFLKEKRGD